MSSIFGPKTWKEDYNNNNNINTNKNKNNVFSKHCIDVHCVREVTKRSLDCPWGCASIKLAE